MLERPSIVSVTQGIHQPSYKVIIARKKASEWLWGGIITWDRLVRKQAQDVAMNDVAEERSL